MKNILKSTIIVLVLFVGFCLRVHATDGNAVSFEVSYNVDNYKIYNDQEFIVTVKYKTSDSKSIQAAAIDWTYDNDKLELLSCADGTYNCSKGDFNGILIGDPISHQLIVTDNDSPRSGNVRLVKLRFKAKSTMAVGNTATITFNSVRVADQDNEVSQTLSEGNALTFTKIEKPTYLRGNWNDEDNVVDLKDAIHVLRYASKLEPEYSAYAGFKPEKKAALNVFGAAGEDPDLKDAITILKIASSL